MLDSQGNFDPINIEIIIDFNKMKPSDVRQGGLIFDGTKKFGGGKVDWQINNPKKQPGEDFNEVLGVVYKELGQDNYEFLFTAFPATAPGNYDVIMAIICRDNKSYNAAKKRINDYWKKNDH
jgi:hypothetical protein